MKEKIFHLGDILSVTTGYLVSPNRMDGVYDILNFMTGESLSTHQLIRASKECRPYLLKLHPYLKEIDSTAITPGNCTKWLNKQVLRFGEELLVRTLPEGQYKVKNPILEAAEMMDKRKD